MTLVTPSRRRPPAYHKKVTGAHHRKSKAYNKTYWPYLPLLLIVVLGLVFNTAVLNKHSVLGYATDMSVQELLDDTNAQRSANGEGNLRLNQQLINAATAKANDMATRNYWSHNTPDGQTPWTFFTAAGYDYQLAGENLAYGFATAADTLTGWMNSPEHRANILNAGYVDVGFAFVNIPNYQSTGPETLVVAEYGAPAQAVSVSTPASAAGTSGGGTTQAANPQTTSPPPVASTPTPPAAPTPAAPATNAAVTPQQTSVVTPADTHATKVEPKQQSISRVQLLTGGKAPWSLFVLSVLGAAAVIFLVLRHGLAWHKIFVRGERFVLHHPWLDALLVAIIMLVFVLVHRVGVLL